MDKKPRRRKAALFVFLFFGLLPVSFWGPAWAGQWLVREDPLAPAAALVVLGGQLPFREMEAAALYRAGWAETIILVRGAPTPEYEALLRLEAVVLEHCELRRQVLLKLGVPAQAIHVAKESADRTLAELRIAHQALPRRDAPVILVTSKAHSRRVGLLWRYVAVDGVRGIVRVASEDPFDPRGWWRHRTYVHSVLREYLGLLHYWAGFPI